MGRPFASYTDVSHALELYARGSGLTQMQEVISRGEGSPSMRTVSYWIARFRKIPGCQLDLDRPFDWHHMENYEIPWEAAELISRIFPGDFPLSVRRSRWVWRIHLANSRLLDVQVRDLVSRCVVLEHMDLLAIGGNLDDEWRSIWRKLGNGDSAGVGSERSLYLLDGMYAVCNMDADMVLPEWIGGQGFVSITRTQIGMSVVCLQDPMPSDQIDGMSVSRGWACLRLPDGEVPKFGEISWMVITTATEIYLLVKESEITQLMDLASKAGYRLSADRGFR